LFPDEIEIGSHAPRAGMSPIPDFVLGPRPEIIDVLT